MTSTKLSSEEITQQLHLLSTYRRTLTIYLQQRAEIGRAYSPPGLLNGINETQAHIRRIKALLRSANVVVTDDPDDEDEVYTSVYSTPIRSSERHQFIRLSITSALPGLIILIAVFAWPHLSPISPRQFLRFRQHNQNPGQQHRSMEVHLLCHQHLLRLVCALFPYHLPPYYRH